MSDLDDLAATIGVGLTAVGVAKQAVFEAAHQAADARDTLAQVLAETNDPEAAMLPAQFDDARARCERFTVWLDSTTATLQGYLARLGGSIAPEVSQISAPKSQDEPRVRPGVHTASPQPPPISHERLDELRAELPPPVTPGKGQKTHGRWVDGRGQTHVILSETDEWEAKVNAALVEERCPRVPITRASDVELRLAAMMRERGKTDVSMRHVTVLINNTPCGGAYGCDRLLPAVLPDGYTITVHGTDGFVKTYTGGGSPRWR